MSDTSLRKRGVAETTKTNSDADSQKDTGIDEQNTRTHGIGVLDILRVLLGVFILSSAMSWFITGESFLWGWKPWFTQYGQVKAWLGGPVSLTDVQLAAYDGTDPKKPIYVGLNGSIYDVSQSPHTYGPGGSYHFFSGKDAARAFITGCFKDDQTPDLRGVEMMYIPLDDENESLSKGELKTRRERDMRVAKKKVKEGIDHWAKVFRGETGRPYFWVGEIKREEGWLEKLPKRDLCEAAAKARPQREDVKS